MTGELTALERMAGRRRIPFAQKHSPSWRTLPPGTLPFGVTHSFSQSLTRTLVHEGPGVLRLLRVSDGWENGGSKIPVGDREG